MLEKYLLSQFSKILDRAVRNVYELSEKRRGIPYHTDRTRKLNYFFTI